MIGNSEAEPGEILIAEADHYAQVTAHYLMLDLERVLADLFEDTTREVII